MKIYLAGGMRSGWQDALIAACPEVEFIDPRSHGLTEPAAYTAWDLDGVRRCDLLLAYMEPDNPSLYGLSLEVGYAHGLGKPVWLVGSCGEARERYFGMVESVASVRLATIQQALAALKGV